MLYSYYNQLVDMIINGKGSYTWLWLNGYSLYVSFLFLNKKQTNMDRLVTKEMEKECTNEDQHL